MITPGPSPIWGGPSGGHKGCVCPPVAYFPDAPKVWESNARPRGANQNANNK